MKQNLSTGEGHLRSATATSMDQLDIYGDREMQTRTPLILVVQQDRGDITSSQSYAWKSIQGCHSNRCALPSSVLLDPLLCELEMGQEAEKDTVMQARRILTQEEPWPQQAWCCSFRPQPSAALTGRGSTPPPRVKRA